MPNRPKKTRKAEAAPAAATPGNAAQDYARDFATARSATTARTPAIVRAAFFPAKLTVGGKELRPCTLATYMLLEDLGNPLAEITASSAPELGTTDIAQALYILAHSVQECRALFNRSRDEFDAAVYAFAETISADEIATLGEKLTRQVAGAFETALPMTEKKTETSPSPSGPAAAPVIPGSAGG
jgi:hypothetical protein